MAKLKRRTPPLFELLDGNRLRRGDSVTHPNLRVINAEPEAEEVVAPEKKKPFSAPSQETSAKPGEHAILQFLGDRLHLSLTPFTAAIGLFAVSLLVLGAIYLGQQRGQKAALQAASQAILEAEFQDIESVRQQPPVSHLIEGLLAGGAKPPVSPVRQAEKPASKPQSNPLLATPADLPAGPQQGWVRDFTYIMTQEFAAGRVDDAKRAQEFLKSKGFPAEIVKLDNGALQLITLEGYNHKDSAQKKKADALLKKQRAAGTEYFASGGGYKLEGYFKTLKKDEW